MGVRSLKFLVMSKPKSVIDVPPRVLEVWLRSTKDWFAEMISGGKIDCSYALAGELAGTVSIFDVQSNEELDDLIQDIPISSVVDFEIYPLADNIRALEIGAKSSEKASKLWREAIS